MNYIILRSSTEQAAWDLLSPEEQGDPANFQGKKFKVVFASDFGAGYRKNGSYNDTIGGKIDAAAGSIYYQWNGTIKTSYELTAADTADHYGSYTNLENYYLLNNPNGSPSMLVTLVDHYGVEHAGFLTDNHVPTPLTVYMVGPYAIYFIKLAFRQQMAIL